MISSYNEGIRYLKSKTINIIRLATLYDCYLENTVQSSAYCLREAYKYTPNRGAEADSVTIEEPYFLICLSISNFVKFVNNWAGEKKHVFLHLFLY